MELIPIKESLEENPDFNSDPSCKEILEMTLSFYTKVGYSPPWISYFARLDGRLVGCGAFKGEPRAGMIEIAYGTFEPFRKAGVGTEICRQLVLLSVSSDPSVRITARTLPEENYSTRILKKNSFMLSGIVNDPEDGEVWEWEFMEHLNK